MYQLYKCRCRREFILIDEQLNEAISKGIYITCPYCSSKYIRLEGKYESLKQCMDGHNIYKKINGAYKQIR